MTSTVPRRSAVHQDVRGLPLFGLAKLGGRVGLSVEHDPRCAGVGVLPPRRQQSRDFGQHLGERAPVFLGDLRDAIQAGQLLHPLLERPLHAVVREREPEGLGDVLEVADVVRVEPIGALVDHLEQPVRAPFDEEGEQDEGTKAACPCPAGNLDLAIGEPEGRALLCVGGPQTASSRERRRSRPASAAEQQAAEDRLRCFVGADGLPGGVNLLGLETKAGRAPADCAGSNGGGPLLETDDDGAAARDLEEDRRHLLEKRHERGAPIGRSGATG